MPTLIELRGVTKRFGENIVFDNLSLDIPENSIFGIIGKSGGGKTTLLNLVVGFLKPNRGNVYYKGLPFEKHFITFEKAFGFASQSPSLYNQLNVTENLKYFGKLYNLKLKDIEERSQILIRLLELQGSEKNLAKELSSGMKKRLDIACALIHDPDVLILDEPTADLDPVLRVEIFELIKKIKESGTTIIITTHNLGEIEYLCDEIILLHNKKLFRVGNPKTLNKHYSKQITLELESGQYHKLVQALKSKAIKLESIRMDTTALIINTKEPEEVLNTITEHDKKYKDNIKSINVGKPSLEYFFKQIAKT